MQAFIEITALEAITGLDAEVPFQVLCREVAAHMLRTRVLRQQLLHDLPSSDGVWDMLLDLYVAESRGKTVSVSDLALAALVPRSTGLRLVCGLVEDGHLERQQDPRDGRRSFVTLAEHTRARLDYYFTQSAAPLMSLAVATANFRLIEKAQI